MNQHVTGRRNIVIGQKVDGAKAARARQLRREMTVEERLLWRALRRNQLGIHFRRQQVIDGFIADFYCHGAGLVIEVDGAVHDTEEQDTYDSERDAILGARGLRVLRFSAAEVKKNAAAVLEEISFATTNVTTEPEPITPPLLGEGKGERSHADRDPDL